MLKVPFLDGHGSKLHLAELTCRQSIQTPANSVARRVEPTAVVGADEFQPLWQSCNQFDVACIGRARILNRHAIGRFAFEVTSFGAVDFDFQLRRDDLQIKFVFGNSNRHQHVHE